MRKILTLGLLSGWMLACNPQEQADQSIPKLPPVEVEGEGIDAIYAYWADPNAVATFPTPIPVRNARVTFVDTKEFFVQETPDGRGLHLYEDTNSGLNLPTGVPTPPKVGDIVSFEALKWINFRGELEVTAVQNYTVSGNRTIDDLITDGDTIDWDKEGDANLGRILRVIAKVTDTQCTAAGTSPRNWTINTTGYPTGTTLVLRTICNAEALAWQKGVCLKIVANVTKFISNTSVTTFQLQKINKEQEPIAIVNCPTGL